MGTYIADLVQLLILNKMIRLQTNPFTYKRILWKKQKPKVTTYEKRINYEAHHGSLVRDCWSIVQQYLKDLCNFTKGALNSQLVFCQPHTNFIHSSPSNRTISSTFIPQTLEWTTTGYVNSFCRILKLIFRFNRKLLVRWWIIELQKIKSK